MDLRRIASAFDATLGVFTADQLRARGIPARHVKRWVATGAVERVCGKAFAVRGTAITVRRRAVAARLTWPDAIICLTTAALLHEIRVVDDGFTHVLVPSPRRAIAGIQPHLWSVHPSEVTTSGPLVVTDRRTTIADCLGRLPDEDAWGLLAWMYTRDQLSVADLEAQLADRRGMYGIVRLRLMAATIARGAVSRPEILLQDFLVEHRVTGWVPDFAIRRSGRVVARTEIGFPVGRLALEYDGVIAHGPEMAVRDARRQEAVEACGYEVLRVTWFLLHERRGPLRDTIRAILVESDPTRRRALARAWNARDSGALTALL